MSTSGLIGLISQTRFSNTAIMWLISFLSNRGIVSEWVIDNNRWILPNQEYARKSLQSGFIPHSFYKWPSRVLFINWLFDLCWWHSCLQYWHEVSSKYAKLSERLNNASTWPSNLGIELGHAIQHSKKSEHLTLDNNSLPTNWQGPVIIRGFFLEALRFVALEPCGTKSHSRPRSSYHEQ